MKKLAYCKNKLELKEGTSVFEKYSDVVGVCELCEMLKIGKNTAYYLLRTNAILSLRIGKSIKIPKKYIIDYCTVR